MTANGRAAPWRRRFDDAVERASSALGSIPRSRVYPVLGVGLALGALAGFLVERAIAAGRLPTFPWVLGDVGALLPRYVWWLSASLAGVLALLGHLLGRRVDRLSLLSITDPLTGLFNRRHFRRLLTEEIVRSRRHGHTLCVLCLDIDRLEAINEGFGHRAGDLALMWVSRTLLANVRAIDAVARIGGDEFAVLLPDTSAIQVSTLATRILGLVSCHDGTLAGTLAVSIGIAERASRGDVETEDMIAAADAALFRAKAAGGGRAAIARPEAVAPHSRHFTLMQAALIHDSGKRPAANDGAESHGQRSAAECPVCRRAVAEVCGGSILQQSWFRLARYPGLCPGHRAEPRVSE